MIAKSVLPMPPGFHTVTPFLVVADPVKLIEFLKQGFGAQELFRTHKASGALMHAQVQIGDSILMISDLPNEPGKGKPGPAVLYLYVEDADAVYQHALEAGATSIAEPADQFYGDRCGGVRDPLGNAWWIATHQEQVPTDELERRAKEATAEPSAV